ncbi:MAG TPA: class I tRNA ligase family protein, partial [Exilispira sp.]|nr:class I tRNA ligase family protein [Exilispira sp.]
MNNKTDLNDRYNPSEFEEKIYKLWESSGAFKVRIDKSKKSYVIPMPPPNVTGILHMGHGL